MNNRIISKNRFDIRKTLILTFDYNIQSNADYGMSIFFGNYDLMYNSKIQNKKCDYSAGLYSKTKPTQFPSFISVCMDNKGKFALSNGKYIDGKDELNNYNTLTVRHIDNNTNYKYLKDTQIDDFYTPADKFNTIKCILKNGGTNLSINLKKYNSEKYIILDDVFLPKVIKEINKNITTYTFGISTFYTEGKLILRNIAFSTIG